mgnify:CR=1 FL=1
MVFNCLIKRERQDAKDETCGRFYVLRLAFLYVMKLLFKADGHPIYAVVENVRSLFNVGAIFRSADGVNASGIYLTGFTGCPPRKEISRVALGAEEVIPWHYERDTGAVINGLRDGGVQVVALEQTPNSVDYRTFVYQWPSAVIFGHEVTGVRPETLDLCDGVVHIPMLGHKVSLNVSVAAGVMHYELLSQFQNSNV